MSITRTGMVATLVKLKRIRRDLKDLRAVWQKYPKQYKQCNEALTVLAAFDYRGPKAKPAIKKLEDSYTILRAKVTIEKALKDDGPYAHNIIGVALTQVDAAVGPRAANALIKKYSLGARYGFVEQDADGNRLP